MSKDCKDSLYVKFTPYSAKLLSSLINKEIKLSRVYELNDYNELSNICIPPNDSDRYYEIIRDYFSSNQTKLIQLLDNALLSGRYTKQIINEHKDRLNYQGIHNFISHTEQLPAALIIENIVYENIGIYCMSRLSVFENDCAQLMFAHYAKNLKGLALIYEGDLSIVANVQYEGCGCSKLLKANGRYEDIKKLIDKKYTEIENLLKIFTYKSHSWGYENESRIFGEPGIVPMSNYRLRLKAILYTPRFDETNLEALKKINSKFFSGNLLVTEIYASHESDKKFLFTGNKECVKLESLKELIDNNVI